MKFWKEKNIISYSLYPLSLLFRSLAGLRKYGYQIGLLKHSKFNVPIIVVGNIAVGGTGKTPLVIFIANLLKRMGYCPGIVSRGYGGQSNHYPLNVTADADPSIVGDEPLLIARQTQCPLVVDPVRARAVEALLKNSACNCIIADDGLQHYALKRDIEIAVVNEHHNGFCLPAGPLREPMSRLKEVDFVVDSSIKSSNQYDYHMKINPVAFCQVGNNSAQIETDAFKNKKCHAVAAIANPERFFSMLEKLNIPIIPHVFPDHYRFQKSDLSFNDELPMLMTEKDAVKCESMGLERAWFLRIEAALDDAFERSFLKLLTSAVIE